jgi:5-(carboxyamino)imidazole ribonucleotide synthase
MRIGIVGAGQLGLMLGVAARDLGHSTVFLDPSGEPPAGVVGPVIKASFDDRAALTKLAGQCDVLTYEFENVPVDALSDIEGLVPIYPPLDALRQAQDRLAEKRLFESFGIPTAAYRAVGSAAELEAAADSIGVPLVVKTRRMGYDGKGQAVLRDAGAAAAVWQKLGPEALLAESRIEFDFEVSAIGVRAVDGRTAVYSLTRNEHRAGILRVSRAPIRDTGLTATAQDYVRELLEGLGYVGVLALELFVVGESLLANEFAPRVHNSGHWTIEGAETSQFANHILAITNAAPGSVANRDHAGMINLIGTIPAAARTLSFGCLHDYGKSPRAGRKLGHITVVAESEAERDRQLAEIDDSVMRSTGSSGHGR